MNSTYQEQKPTRPLARWVECAWSLSNDAPTPRHSVRPDGCIDLLFSTTSGLFVVGAMNTSKEVDQPAQHYSVGVRFHPGMARSFFRVDADELTDQIVPAAELFGPRMAEVESQLSDAASAEKRIRLMLTAIGVPGHEPNPMQLAIEAITSQDGVANLDQMANQANLSARQFRRRCLQESGLAPKQLCRILRFRRATQLALRHYTQGWANIAAWTGYFDQAHLIRDFREFAGGPPMSVLSKTP